MESLGTAEREEEEQLVQSARTKGQIRIRNATPFRLEPMETTCQCYSEGHKGACRKIAKVRILFFFFS